MLSDLWKPEALPVSLAINAAARYPIMARPTSTQQASALPNMMYPPTAINPTHTSNSPWTVAI